MIKVLIVMLFALIAACGGSESVEKEAVGLKGLSYEKLEDGTIVRKFDIDGDGKTDVTKYLVEYPDPEDPAITITRMTKKEVDANSDGSPDIVKHYNEFGDIMREEVDVDLNGSFDLVNHLDDGVVAKKEILVAGKDPETPKVDSTRYYTNGTITRIEKDTDGDTKIDLWEFYEQGVLDRIGRDLNGDGRADTWQTR